MVDKSADSASRKEKPNNEMRMDLTPESRETEDISNKPLPQQAVRLTTNAIRDGLNNGRFFWTIEFIPSRDKNLHDELLKLAKLADIISKYSLLAGFAVTDRVVSDQDPDSAEAASHFLNMTGKQPLVHFSGKGREIQHLKEFLSRLHGNGLENVLMVTGDRLRQEPQDRRPRYLESVPAIRLAKQFDSNLLIAAALNPFKYCEEDAMAQYLKLGKKVAAGADCVITQIGFDMPKYKEALLWMETRGYRIPFIANVMPMSAPRARYIRKQQLPGLTVTDSLLALLEEEERTLPDKGAARVLRRLALQIIGVQHFGYSGVQITGLHSVEKVAALKALVQELSEQCPDSLSLQKAWNESLISAEGGQANPVPPHDPWYLKSQYSSRASLHERVKYKSMRGVHGFLFDRGFGARLLGPLMKPVKRHGTVDRIFERIERAIKSPLFGCETCGMCRLAATQYICPETCPKGLANGACGGTTDNLCEFGDRECVHSVKYRIAKDADVLHELESWLVPAVPQDTRHTCSWPPHYRGEGPDISIIDFLHSEKKREHNG